MHLFCSLIDDNVSMTQPNDVSYVSAGYAPLLVRLVQSLGLSLSPTRSGGGVGGGGGGGDACSWAGILEAMKLLPGPMLEFSQLHSRAEELTDALNRCSRPAGPASLLLGEFPQRTNTIILSN